MAPKRSTPAKATPSSASRASGKRRAEEDERLFDDSAASPVPDALPSKAPRKEGVHFASIAQLAPLAASTKAMVVSANRTSAAHANSQVAGEEFVLVRGAGRHNNKKDSQSLASFTLRHSYGAAEIPPTAAQYEHYIFLASRPLFAMLDTEAVAKPSASRAPMADDDGEKLTPARPTGPPPEPHGGTTATPSPAAAASISESAERYWGDSFASVAVPLESCPLAPMGGDSESMTFAESPARGKKPPIGAWKMPRMSTTPALPGLAFLAATLPVTDVAIDVSVFRVVAPDVGGAAQLAVSLSWAAATASENRVTFMVCDTDGYFAGVVDDEIEVGVCTFHENASLQLLK